jgi:UDP-N-acetylglucosamine 1-carboxyvinyltransferase
MTSSMDRLFVTGGARLAGTVQVAGAKNAALKHMAAALLAPGSTTLHNVPRILDCMLMGRVLEHLGVKVAWQGHSVTIDATVVEHVEAPYELVRQMRASIVALGPLLARTRKARVSLPGGDEIGSRPIDLHLAGLRRMGAEITLEHGFVVAEAPRGLRGGVITLDYPSVGATENLMMAAVSARGTTVIDNAAREPEIADVASLLVAMGAQIHGAGSSTIEIAGVEEFRAVEHRTIPDRIEAGTWAAAAVATRAPPFEAHRRRRPRGHRGRGAPGTSGRSAQGRRLRDPPLSGARYRLPADLDGRPRGRRWNQHRHGERVRESGPVRG